MTEREQAIKALHEVCKAIVETVNETPSGAPAGVIYSALLQCWPSLTAQNFNTMISGLCAAGKMRRVGDMLYKV